MTRRWRSVCLVVLVCGFAAPAWSKSDTGRIEGRVTARDGRAQGGVWVAVAETGDGTLSDANGAFFLTNIPPGSYTLQFTLGTQTGSRDGIVVTAGTTTRVDLKTEWDPTFSESLTVYSASRKEERIVEAPAAVTVIGEEEIERKASHGQLPKLLEFTPGAEVTQSGIYDYNFNTRGFNSSLNRRVATLIDGRDPSVPFLGAQEWAAVGFPLDDIAAVEFVRGPSAALYGSNASSGVVNVTTKQPRYSEGGLVRLAGGELSTVNADFRYADEIGGGWFWKVTAGARTSGDFTVSRNGAAEYAMPCPVPQGSASDCLPQEAVPLERMDDDDIYFGSVRFDKYTEGGGAIALETGYADVAGPVFQTGIGRVQVVDVKRPWFRANYSRPHWNLLTYYNRRKADRQLALASGANVALDDQNWQVELQTNWDLGRQVRVVGGASYGEEEIDSKDPGTGLQTLVFEPVDSDFTALFAQLDWTISDKLKLVVAARWDDSSLHDSQVSPKGSLVWSLSPDHSLRFTYNEAFQVANYSEFFLFAPAAPPTDLTGLNTNVCLSSGVDCGLGITPTLALGNANLELEQIETFEVGYTGILGKRTFLTVDYYNSDNSEFITDLLPNVGTPLGRINPDFGPWAGSMAVETTPVNPVVAMMFGLPPGTTVGQAVRALAPLLSNDPVGANIIGAVSYTNFGQVDTQGVDLGLKHFFGDNWSIDFTYSWFDFEIQESAPGLDQILLPNTPEHKLGAAAGYRSEKLDGSLSARWVDEFRWIVGPFQGDVESYTTVDLSGNYRFTENWSAGINVANLFDDEHWEAFGGDLLGRRALAHVAYVW